MRKVLARAGIGPRKPEYGQHILHPHRLHHLLVDVPGWPPFQVLNGYLKDRIGPTAANSIILASMGQCLTYCRGPCIAGAGWSMSVNELDQCGFPSTARVTMAAPPQVTCRGGT
eukprot:5798413-Pyramimonas_sp.AAC.1